MTSSSDDILTGLLAECGDLILAGASIETCLDRYPEHAVKLGPMLSTLVQVRELRPVPARSDGGGVADPRRSLWQRPCVCQTSGIAPRLIGQHGWRFGGFLHRPLHPAGHRLGYAAQCARRHACHDDRCDPARHADHRRCHGFRQGAAGGHALPGEDIASERVQLLFTRDPLDRSNLQRKFAGHRIDEAQAVAQQGRRVASLPLDGTIDALRRRTVDRIRTAPDVHTGHSDHRYSCARRQGARRDKCPR